MDALRNLLYPVPVRLADISGVICNRDVGAGSFGHLLSDPHDNV